MEQAVAGFAAGTISTLIMHPLDLAKTQLQVTRVYQHTGLRNVVNANVNRQHFFRSLYRGLTVNLIGSTASWGSYFFIYEKCKNAVASYSNIPVRELSSFQILGCSYASGLAVAALTNPIWVVKSRILSRSVPYTSFLTGIRELLRNQGIKGCYVGIVPSFVGVCQGSLQFMAYERLKKHYNEPMSSLQYLSVSALSKVFSSLLMYPVMVFRTRLQVRDTLRITDSKSLMSLRLPQIIADLYKGYSFHLLRVVPQTCITLLVYEQTYHFLKKDTKNK
ncbi:FAD transporter [Schizosaccharomyces japonicus yFS275]|uniref:FAD transporter n=1 Tax=Schizosaccharomyces japonicus (strain yFS275 / FY16936) TaxID=402676 RepID=B6K4E7_SCHJY|nr:FAD transporter [Schizosaccharomyces japonicus yFS275]EEB08354.2 FAD transporter [Schizosaccharomyces japonicus yFS275]